jgi:hypothetical protein
MYYSPFTGRYPAAAMELAKRTLGPVLAIDYPLSPAGSWRDQAEAAMLALRWLASWDGAVAGGVCRPGRCGAAAAAAGRGPVAAGAKTFQQLLDAEAIPSLAIGGAATGRAVHAAAHASGAGPALWEGPAR